MNIANKKILILSIIIVSFDLLTKILAFNLLPFQHQISFNGEQVGFYLTYNTDSIGGQADYLLNQENNKNLALIISSIIGMILMMYTILIFHKKIKTGYKWFIGFGIFVLAIIITEILKPFFSELAISNWITSVISKIAGISIYLTIFILTKNNLIRLFTSIIISAGIGNFIGHFYYPFRIIDFINIKGSYELLQIGVFNFADLAFYIGFISLIFTMIGLLIRKIRNYSTQQQT
jgi:lipoprotein signal peptidase